MTKAFYLSVFNSGTYKLPPLSPLLQLGVRPLENGNGANLPPVGLTACSVEIVKFIVFVGRSSLCVFFEVSSSLEIEELAPLDFVCGDEVGLFD